MFSPKMKHKILKKNMKRVQDRRHDIGLIFSKMNMESLINTRSSQGKTVDHKPQSRSTLGHNIKSELIDSVKKIKESDDNIKIINHDTQEKMNHFDKKYSQNRF